MRNDLKILLLLLCTCFLFCDKLSTSSELENVEFSFSNGHISADLSDKNNIDPKKAIDPIDCRIEILIKNHSSNRIYLTLTPEAEIFLDSDDKKIGTLSIISDWDGVLLPQSQDTIRLKNNRNEVSKFNYYLNEYVYLEFNFESAENKTNTFKTGNIYFQGMF